MKFRVPSSPPARLQRRECVQPLPPQLARRRPLWLLAADVCVFVLLDLRQVPARLRARAIAERVRQLAPFATAGWHAADHDGEVALWCWDEARVRAAIDAEGTGSAWEVLPEQLFLVPPADAGVRAGVLERWRGGRLVFSAPLPVSPAARALTLRAAGLAADADPPELARSHAAQRWDRHPTDWRSLAREPLAVAVAAVALATLWLLWSLGDVAGWEYAREREQRSLERQREALAPVLAQREDALRLAERNRALLDLLGPPSALEVAAEFEHLAGPRYQRLLAWEFGARTLRATLEDPAPDNRAYVEALTRSPWFERVGIAAAQRADQIALEITLAALPAGAPAYLARDGSAER